VYLRSYVDAGSGDLDLLNPAAIAAITPVLLGRSPIEEIVGIGTWGSCTGALACWPVTSLDDAGGALRLVDLFKTADCRGLWLLAFTSDTKWLAPRIAALQEAMAGTVFHGNDQLLQVTCDGLQWTRLVPRRGEAAPGVWFPVPQVDPVAARLWALVCRAGIQQSRTLQRLRGRPGGTVLDAARAARHEAIGRRRATAAEDLAESDRNLLRETLAAPVLPLQPRLVELGIALASDPGLLAEAIEAVWKEPCRERRDLWRAIANVSFDEARDTAMALVAFAAWRSGNLALATAALELILGHCECSLAYWLADLIAYGVSADDLDRGTPLVPAHLLGRNTEGEA
jgi:hypothetical protein